jgi:Protein of unknown function (DUF2586)
MGLPTVQINVQDNGLGQLPTSQGNVIVVVGVSSAGSANTPLESTAAATDLVPTYGYGPGPQLTALIQQQSGNSVIFVKAVTAADGTNTAVGKTIPGGSTAVMSITGTPNDTYYGLVTVAIGGTIGTAGIQIAISLDAGRTTYATANLGTGSTFVIPNTGLTLSFSGGTLLAQGDSFFWVSTEPTWSDAGVASAIQSLYNLPFGETFLDLAVVGGGSETSLAGTPGCTNGDVVAIDAQMTALFNKRRYTRCLVQSRDALWGGASTETESVWEAAVIADHVNDSSLRVGVTAGYYNCVSPIDQVQYRRPLLFFAAARDAQVAIQVDLGRVKDGALANLTVPSSPDGYIYHNESQLPGFDAARFISALTYVGKPGFFIANPNLMAPPGSDFNWLQHGHVIDAASAIAYNFFVTELSDSIRVNSSTGYPLQQDVNDLILRCQAQLNSQLVYAGAVSGATVTIPANQNVLSTSTLNVVIAVVPLGYLKKIIVTIQFVNPAIQQVNQGTTSP